MLSPDPIPPAAINGTVVICLTAGIRHRVVVSSRPLCPPASNPSATMASTPASSHLAANLVLATTWATMIPCSCRCSVQVFGFPAEVKTIFTPSSITILIRMSISGYISGMFTPKGLSVAALHFCMCSRKVSGCMEPAPISPSPPALLTAEASRQPLHHTIPPCMMGYFIPKRLQILFICNNLVICLFANVPITMWDIIQPISTLTNSSLYKTTNFY